jgi:hypothetical protein
MVFMWILLAYMSDTPPDPYVLRIWPISLIV